MLHLCIGFAERRQAQKSRSIASASPNIRFFMLSSDCGEKSSKK